MDHPKSNSTSKSAQTAWQIPAGVDAGNWDYVRSRGIADQYDDFLKGDPLDLVESRILGKLFPTCQSGQTIADFGCGTGRTLFPLMQRGYSGLAIDLSLPMLERLGGKLIDQDIRQSCWRVQANLVELNGIQDDSVNHGVSMFSTLGMIQGRENRLQFLKHVQRIIKPSGYFVVHAHNVWFMLRHRKGLRQIIRSLLKAMASQAEFGDQRSTYRGLKDIFIHSFRKSELAKDLQTSGFRELDWYGVAPNQSVEFKNSGFWNNLSLVGWIIVCKVVK